MEDLNDKVFGDLLTSLEWNQVPSEIQNIIEARGITLSSSDLNQLGKGVAAYASNGSFYTDSGPANAYVLTGIGTQQTAAAYEDGMEIVFFPVNNNTGASTVNVAGLGVTNIKNIDGTDPISGVINNVRLSVARYDTGTGTFRLIIEPIGSETVPGLLEIATNAEAIAKSATDKALVPSNLSAMDSSATFKGLIEIATNAEATAKSATDKALVPSNLGSLDASTTATGFIEIATNAEATAKSATDKALVPSNLSAMDSSATFKGLIEIATQAEVDAGTDTVRAVTPATLASAPPSAGSVNQAALKTSIGEVSTSLSINLTLPGGEYGFYAQVKHSGGGSGSVQMSVSSSNTSYVTNVFISAASGVGFAQHRYVQASPPYDLGDGVIQLFVFVLLDKATSEVLATYTAQDPVWANNGPTIVNPLGKRKIDPAISGKFVDVVNNPTKLKNYLDSLNSPIGKIDNKVKATQAHKNADMNLIPHPFPDFDAAKHVVAMIDPVSQFNENLFNIHEFSGDSIAEILHGGHMGIDNTPLALTMPEGVIAVKARFK